MANLVVDESRARPAFLAILIIPFYWSSFLCSRYLRSARYLRFALLCCVLYHYNNMLVLTLSGATSLLIGGKHPVPGYRRMLTFSGPRICWVNPSNFTCPPQTYTHITHTLQTCWHTHTHTHTPGHWHTLHPMMSSCGKTPPPPLSLSLCER